MKFLFVFFFFYLISIFLVLFLNSRLKYISCHSILVIKLLKGHLLSFSEITYYFFFASQKIWCNHTIYKNLLSFFSLLPHQRDKNILFKKIHLIICYYDIKSNNINQGVPLIFVSCSDYCVIFKKYKNPKFYHIRINMYQSTIVPI